MLAYVFWHWARPGIGRPDYEATQRAFHDAPQLCQACNPFGLDGDGR